VEWSKVVYVFFILMSLTSTAGFLYEHSSLALFIAGSLNVASTILKIGVRNILSAELFAGSLVADLHLIPAFVALEVYGHLGIAIALAIGAVIANLFSIAIVLIESSKTKEEY
jgi:hypothetical protein